jgi:hypothetical protein
MAQVLKVGKRDLSAFIRTAHEDGLDPANPEYTEPQFTGSPAFSEGQSWIGDAVQNREMSVPLVLSADSTDDLYSLIRDINAELGEGIIVEYRSGGASNSTFFNLERGRLEPKYEFWLDQAAKTRALLRLWVQPRGHTGTTRLVSSQLGTGPQLISASGLHGDVSAQGVLRVAIASLGSLGKPLVMFGVKSSVSSGWSPIYTANRFASTLTQPITPVTATTQGASGRLASQYRAWAVVPTSLANNQMLFRLPLREVDSGRYRVLLSFRTSLLTAGGSNVPSAHLRLFKHDPVSFQESPNVYLTSFTQNRWRLLDFGEISVGTTSGQVFELRYFGAPGASAFATYPVQSDGGVLLPLDENAGVLIGEDVSDALAPAGSRSISLDAVKREVVMRAATGGSDAFIADQTARLRGGFPELQPGHSAQILVWAAPYVEPLHSPEQRVADPTHYSLAARERFSYLR